MTRILKREFLYFIEIIVLRKGGFKWKLERLLLRHFYNALCRTMDLGVYLGLIKFGGYRVC